MDLSSCGAIVTGASRGIGVSIAEALAERGVRLVLTARSEGALEEVRDRLVAKGAEVAVVATDVVDDAALERLVVRANEALGTVDLLVNNAAVEQVAYYESLPLAAIERVLRVNLWAPMALTRMVLPDMLARDRGHVVNVSSLAGLGPSAFNEPYCASKHGLVGFTRSLRASLQTRKSRVSASVVFPAFVRDAGMFADASREYGIRAPAMMGSCTPADVARATLRAIESDKPEVIVNDRPLRPAFVLSMIAPRLGEWLARVSRAHEAFRVVAERRLEAHDADVT